MIFHRSLAAVIVAALLAAAPAPIHPEAEAAARRFVLLNNAKRLQSPEGKALLAGELETADLVGEGELPPPDRLLKGTDSLFVARVPARAGSNPDLYLSLRPGRNGWKVVAIRALAMTGLFEELIRLGPQEPEPSAETKQALRQARLIVSADRDLIAWARAHLDGLESARSPATRAKATEVLKTLGVSSVRTEGAVTFVTIGGLVDNEVGFLWASAAHVPRIDGRTYIWVEPIGGGWYLYKTT